MVPVAKITHESRGRLRLRIPDRRRDNAYFARVAKSLKLCPTIERLDINPTTASILIRHRGDIAQISQCGEDEQVFSIRSHADTAPATPLSTRIIETANRGLRDANEVLKQVSDGTLDVGALSFITLVGAGLVQALRSEFLPAGLTCMLTGFGSLALATHPRLKAMSEAPTKRI